MAQSVEMICHADRDLPSGVTNCLLLFDPDIPINGEHILTSLRRAKVDLKQGSYYRVTFEEIDPPEGSSGQIIT
jgi:hypothetical protein